MQADMNAIAANVAGISHQLYTMPFLGAPVLSESHNKSGVEVLYSLERRVLLALRCPHLGDRTVPHDSAGDISAPVKTVSDTVKATVQTTHSKVSRAAEHQLADQIRAADSTLHSAAEDIASKLPKNNSMIHVPDKPVQALIPAYI